MAFPVVFSGELLPRDSNGSITSTNAVLSATDWNVICMEGPASPPASKFVVVTVLGAPASGVFSVVSDVGPGLLQVSERLADGSTNTLAVATSGSIELTEGTTDRMAGSFDVQLSGSGGSSSLTGTFDAAFCTNHK